MTKPAPATPDRLDVLFCANPGYFQHTAVAAVSLAETTRPADLRIHLMTCERDAGAEALLREALRAHPHATLSVHHVDGTTINGLFRDKHLTKETYLRFLCTAALPPEIGRILYLDSDLVVLDDLSPLARIDLGGAVIAAAPDHPWPLPGEPERVAALGLRPGRTYVNAGVLVIDLDRWRAQNVAEELLDFAARHATRLRLHDQDALNVVLQDRIRIIGIRWNFQARMYFFRRRTYPAEYHATRPGRRRPAVLHFTTDDKPWLRGSVAPRRHEYFRHLRKTPWRNAGPMRETPLRRLEQRLDALLLGAGLDMRRAVARLARLLTASAPARDRGAERGDGRIPAQRAADPGRLARDAAS